MLIWCKKIIVACCQQNRVYNEGADVAGGEERDEKTRCFSLHGGGEAMVALQSFAEGLGWLGQPEYKPDG